MPTNNHNHKNPLIKTLIGKANDAVGCGCGNPKLSGVHEPTPRPKRRSTGSSSSSANKNTSDDDRMKKVSKLLSPCPKIVDSFAVVKDSNDPYEDFRKSMLEMIMENEIYSKDDLKELLSCFLEINNPCHHDVIVRAFTGIWDSEGNAISTRPFS